jgi:hypothetical protein
MHWRKAPSGSDAVVFYFVVMALTASIKTIAVVIPDLSRTSIAEPYRVGP